MQVGFDARPNSLGPQMDKPEPSVETLYVGTMMAMLAIKTFSTNVSAYLAGVPRVDGRPSEDGRACVRRLLADIEAEIGDTGVTDLQPGQYDADLARDIALSTVHEHVREVLDFAL